MPRFDHVFFSWQPRDRGRLRLQDYAPAWDDLARLLPPELPRALHHTALNLAALDVPDDTSRGELVDLTNALCERYQIGWVNEDVGFWSLAGRPLPYPMPPLLDPTGLRACVRNVRACQRWLIAPLVLEFPGFDAGVSLVAGNIDAYDYFRLLAEETGAPVNLDVGHLLSWRWYRGFRGEALFDGLERLPLEACFEIHLSGCEMTGDRFVDAHHGRLISEQLTLLERLIDLCPNLRAVTFEDPRLDEGGHFDPGSAASSAALARSTAPWRRPTAHDAPPECARPSLARVAEIEIERDADADADADAILGSPMDELVLADFVYGRGAPPLGNATNDALARAGRSNEASAAVRAMLRRRSYRGTGTLSDLFPGVIAAWRARHPDDPELDLLFERFSVSSHLASWREQPGGRPGDCLEACFASFAESEGLSNPTAIEEELLAAVLRSLAVTPEPAFIPPPSVVRTARGWFAVSRAAPPVLHAAVDLRYLRGPVTPLIAALLKGASIDAAAATTQVTLEAARTVHDHLAEMGLTGTHVSGARL